MLECEKKYLSRQERGCGCDGESLSRKCVTVGGRPVQKIERVGGESERVELV